MKKAYVTSGVIPKRRPVVRRSGECWLSGDELDDSVELACSSAGKMAGMPVGLGYAQTEIAYQEAFQSVARDYGLIIGLREPNVLGAPLLREGYASKSFHIKAKTSIAGPTAGLVASQAAFGKLGATGAEKQQAYINSAIESGARIVPLRLSDARVRDLVARGLVHMKGETFGTGDAAIYALYGGVRHDFRMKWEDDGSGLPWGVFHESGAPVDILGNPEWLGGPSGAKAAVTADYDLFGLYPARNRDSNVRPLTPVARLVGPCSARIRELANAYLDGIRHADGREEDRDQGNIHFYGRTIKRALCRKSIQQGYEGGLLVHHSDETGNPYSHGQDFPIRFFLPDEQVVFVENDRQLLLAYAWFERSGYSVEVNPAFSFRSF